MPTRLTEQLFLIPDITDLICPIVIRPGTDTFDNLAPALKDDSFDESLELFRLK